MRPLEIEIPLKLKFDAKTLRRLEGRGRYGVENAIKTIAPWVLEPTRSTAASLSSNGIRGTRQRTAGAANTGRGGRLKRVGEFYTAKSFNRAGEEKSVRRKVRAYRAGVGKKSAYLGRGRADSAGGVTLLLSVKRESNYYNFVSNFWEHGWTASGKSVRGNQFMTKAVTQDLGSISRRFSRAVARSAEIGDRRLRVADLKVIK